MKIFWEISMQKYGEDIFKPTTENEFICDE
jgi:hypothetical protein